MKVSAEGIKLIKRFEGYKSKAYVCAGGKNTIGWGTTTYPNGKKVQTTDEIDIIKAHDILVWTVALFADRIFTLVGEIDQNKFDALCSFAYNVGITNFQKSTLLKKVLKDIDDKTIENEFLRWNKASGKILKGLTLRRVAEWRMFKY